MSLLVINSIAIVILLIRLESKALNDDFKYKMFYEALRNIDNDVEEIKRNV